MSEGSAFRLGDLRERKNAGWVAVYVLQAHVIEVRREESELRLFSRLRGRIFWLHKAC